MPGEVMIAGDHHGVATSTESMTGAVARRFPAFRTRRFPAFRKWLWSSHAGHDPGEVNEGNREARRVVVCQGALSDGR